MLGPDTIDSRLAMSPIPNPSSSSASSNWHWMCNSSSALSPCPTIVPSNREPAFASAELRIPQPPSTTANRGLIPLQLSSTSPTYQTALPSEPTHVTSANITLLGTISLRSELASPVLVTGTGCTYATSNNPPITDITITTPTAACDANINGTGESAYSFGIEPASYCVQNPHHDLDHVQLQLHHDLRPTQHLFQTVRPSAITPPASVKLTGSPSEYEPNSQTPPDSEIKQLDQAGLSVVDELNDTFLTCFHGVRSCSSSPTQSTSHQPPSSTSLIESFEQLSNPKHHHPNLGVTKPTFDQSLDGSQAQHPVFQPVDGQLNLASGQDQGHSIELVQLNGHYGLGHGYEREQLEHDVQSSVLDFDHQHHPYHPPPQDVHPYGEQHQDRSQHQSTQQSFQPHHQWDIKDNKLPKVDRFDPYEQWPTGHCRRVYTQSCERARRHQSGWAMRNTNNHNPQVLKKSCLGVLECSAGCLIQGKPLSLRPAICDKARKKQCNRNCITPGCPGRLILRTCRGHSGYPVTHFWRFANGAVYFEAKGEHDHSRPSLKTFGLSEPDQTSTEESSKTYHLTNFNGSLTMPLRMLKTDHGETVKHRGRFFEDEMDTELKQGYVGLSSLWGSAETQQSEQLRHHHHQTSRGRSGAYVGRGKSMTKGGVHRLGRKEKKMTGVRQKALKHHHYKIHSLLETPEVQSIDQSDHNKHQTCDTIVKIPNQQHPTLIGNPIMITQTNPSEVPLVPSIDSVTCPTYQGHNPNQPTVVAMTTPVWYESQNPQQQQQQHLSTKFIAMPSWSHQDRFPDQSSIELKLSPRLHLSGNSFESEHSQIQVLPTFWQLATGNELQTETHSVLSDIEFQNVQSGLNQPALELTSSPVSSIFSSPDWSPSTSSLSGSSTKAVAKSTVAITESIVHHMEQAHNPTFLNQQQHPCLYHSTMTQQSTDGVPYSLTNPSDIQAFVINSLSTTGSTGLLNDSGLSTSSEWMSTPQTDQWFDCHLTTVADPTASVTATTTTISSTVNLMAFSTPSLDRETFSDNCVLQQQTWSYPNCDMSVKVDAVETAYPYYTYCLDDSAVQWFSVDQQQMAAQQQQQQQQQLSSSNWSHESSEVLINPLEMIPESSSCVSTYPVNGAELVPTRTVVAHQSHFPSDSFSKPWDIDLQANSTGLCSESLNVIGHNHPTNKIHLDYDAVVRVPVVNGILNSPSTTGMTYFVTEPNHFSTWPSQTSVASTGIVVDSSGISMSVKDNMNNNNSDNSNTSFVYTHDSFNQSSGLADPQVTQFELTNWNGATTDFDAFCRQCD